MTPAVAQNDGNSVGGGDDDDKDEDDGYYPLVMTNIAIENGH
jgi:hypothetical protein